VSDPPFGRRVLRGALLVAIAVASFVAVVVLMQVATDLLQR